MSTDLAKTVGMRVRELRTRQGLTLEQLSGASGIPPESISRVERGRTVASLRSLARLATGLGVDLGQLVADGAVTSARSDDIPVEVRGVAMLLADRPPEVVAWVRDVVEKLLEVPAGSPARRGGGP